MGGMTCCSADGPVVTNVQSDRSYASIQETTTFELTSQMTFSSALPTLVDMAGS